MKQLFRRKLRSSHKSLLDLIAPGFPRETTSPSGGRRFEPLESRLMLHNGPHAVDPDYDFTTNFSIEADISIYVDSVQVAIPNGSGDGIEAINGAGKIRFEPGPQADFATLGDFFDSWAADPVAGSPSTIALTDTTLFANVEDTNKQLQMFVNGVKVGDDLAGYQIHDLDDIVLVFGANPVVTINTNLEDILPDTVNGEPVRGAIPVELRRDVAPGTAQNFFDYANDGDYDDAIFHRLVQGFVLQGGGFSTTSTTFTSTAQFSDIPTSDPIVNEFNISNTALTVAMAKLGGDPDSATNQFFFNLGDNSTNLDNQNGGFTVFGNVLDPSLLNSATALSTSNEGGAFTDLPLGDSDQVLVIESVSGGGMVSGIKFNDLDRSGDLDVGEPGLPDFQIYSDLNGNDQFDVGEPVAVTNASGEYTLFLDAGEHTIREIPAAGFLQTTPAGPDEYTVTVELGTDDITNLDFGNAAVDAPTGLDLLAVTDSGTSGTDNITNFNNSSSATAPMFQVTGVTAGDTIRVRVDGTIVAEQAVGGDGIVTLDGVTTLSDGSHEVTAAVLANGSETATTSLMITIDATVPTFSSQPPTDATVDELLTYDAASSEEGNTGSFYSLVDPQTGDPISPTTGMVLDSTSGVLTWTPTVDQLGDNSFNILTRDLAGNSATQSVTVNVSRPDIVRLRLAVVDDSGNPISEVNVGDTFQVQIFVMDLRDTAAGVFSAYADVNFDPDLATAIDILHGDSYGQGGVPNLIIDPPQTIADVLTSPGLLDEVGSFAGSIAPLGPTERLLMTIGFEADASGTLAFTTDPADVVAVHEVGLYNRDGSVPNDQIEFGTTSVTVLSNFRVLDPSIGPDEDSAGTTLQIDDLAEFNAGFSGDLTIVSSEQPSNGVVTVAADGKSMTYVPNADYFGADDFEYTVTDGVDLGKGTVSVAVQPVNDDPTAVDDSFEDATNGAQFVVLEDSNNHFLPVLSNDLSDPDDPNTETLRVNSVPATSTNGGTLTISQNGQGVLYSPATDFRGTDTFTYTISDGRGGISGEATVTVSVVQLNDPPTALDDAFPRTGEAAILEDSGPILLDVIANDTTAPDDGEVISLVSVSASPNGSTVVIVNNQVEYTPAADFAGDDTFTYTISDGNGGTAVGNVTVTVTNVNDPPTANDDSGTGFLITENSTANVLDVLANDTAAPDENETLTIESVSGVSAGATVTISSDGQTIEYTPATDFLGMDTFTYIINDGNGLTDTATVTVNVVEFVPGSLTGFVYVDSDNDGIKEPGERGLEGITVTLTGTDIFGSVTRTAVTDINGHYEFDNLAPGDYVVRETQPASDIDGDGIPVLDGTDTIGTQGGTVSANDEFTITLAEGVDGTSNNFGEIKGRTLSGVVFYDSGSGLRLGGLQVSVLPNTGGTALFNTNSSAQGSFDFAGLAPDQYRIEVGAPAFLAQSVNPLSATIADSDSTGNDVTVVSRQAATLSYRDFLTSYSSSAIHAAVQPGAAAQQWSALDTGWNDVDQVAVTLSADASRVTLRVTDFSGVSTTGELPTAGAKVQVLSTLGDGTRLVRLDGSRASFADILTTVVDTGGAGEGEGPSTAAAVEMIQPVLEDRPLPVSSDGDAPLEEPGSEFGSQLIVSPLFAGDMDSEIAEGEAATVVSSPQAVDPAEIIDAILAAETDGDLQAGDVEIDLAVDEMDLLAAVDEVLSNELEI